ncbi:E3 ubiquitin ligase BIG BROTHER-related [Apostasia shenzhenica]|uniref:RING-type E3 ubiquitin transferase n=1 Tax=Apostasia shenzhenica TaxID=1088818 RepID=A0A2I0AJ19_9ASPA|nr:E3 ubiquitin ligase BIG BROTHER-related [Apostasia shenzhenica]
MASADGSSPSTERRGLRRLLRLPRSAAPSVDVSPLIFSSSSHPPPRSTREDGGKKAAFASAAFLGLGCASSAASQVYSPADAAATVRSAAEWQVKRIRRRRSKQRKKERRGQSSSSQAAVAADLCCAPGIAFAARDGSVDCVASHRELVGRGARRDGERSLRERSSFRSSGRSGDQERISCLSNSRTSLQAMFSDRDLMPSGRYLHLRGYYHHPPMGLEEIMLFEGRILSRGANAYDRFQDWRLDVENMTYEELVELGDRIGYVSTGLREEEFASSIRKLKHTNFDQAFSNEMERKCSICQEEYEINDELGKLGCGHSYHMYCIKEWLLQKNACPVCKTAVTKT